MNCVGYYRLPPVKGVFFSPVQEERLLLAGCQEVFSDRCLSSGVVRAGLDKAIAALEPGGALATPSLHALGGTMVDLLDVVLKLKARDLHLVVLQPEIDTRVDASFFTACETLAAFDGERRLVRSAEAALVSRGVRGAGLQGLKGGAVEPEVEPDEDDGEDEDEA